MSHSLLNHQGTNGGDRGNHGEKKRDLEGKIQEIKQNSGLSSKWRWRTERGMVRFKKKKETNTMIDWESSVDLHVYLCCFELFPSQVVPRVADCGSAVTDSRCSCFSADRWAQGQTPAQPENGFSMPLCAATAILLSCQSQTAWLTLSVVPLLNGGGLQTCCWVGVRQEGREGKWNLWRLKTWRQKAGKGSEERKRRTMACYCRYECRVIKITSDGRSTNIVSSDRWTHNEESFQGLWLHTKRG